MRRPIVYAVGAAGAVVVIAVVAALAVDVRLDRQVLLRLGMLVLALICAALLAARATTGRRVIAIAGLVLWGVVAPVYTTVWSTPPEVDFALAVATEAKDQAQRSARSVVGVEDVTAAVRSRGGAVGTLPLADGRIVGADSFPMVLRPDPKRARPRICLTFEHGLDAKIRSC
jgi:hypothetical protein